MNIAATAGFVAGSAFTSYTTVYADENNVCVKTSICTKKEEETSELLAVKFVFSCIA